MTESFRRSGAYENPQDDSSDDSPQGTYPQQQPAASAPRSSAVNPAWPPPSAPQPTEPLPVEPGTTVWPGSTVRPDGQTATPGNAFDTDTGQSGDARYSGGTTPLPTVAFGADTGQSGDAGYGVGTTPLPAVSYGDGSTPHTAPTAPTAHKKRARGPVGLLAAVAIVAAAVGGGTAYAFQELTGKDTTTAGGPTTNVVPAGKRGDVAAIAAAAGPSVVEVNASLPGGSSTGSGVVISASGEIVTNNHVIAGASSVKVRSSDGKEYTADVVGTDSSKDLALIKLQGASGLKPAALGNSSAVQVGDTVVAIGSPEGLTGTVTSGIVSALNRDVTVSTDQNQGPGQGPGQGRGGEWPFQFGGRQFNGDTGSSTTTYKALQTDASLNPGNSGGALIDAGGNVVGINSAMYSAADSTATDAGSVGLGFAIPIDTVKSDLSKLRSGATD
ncbi:trypsin-like peptidase domain-containing protein [Streptomyces sp. NPDC006012]|uniref:S1C family serine protease n=1 Tax=Streptomyces sp. NPDC006012 TaxID=3364739 RepID=UPI0036BA578D